MSANSDRRRMLKKLQRAGLDVQYGRKHTKVLQDGKLITVFPNGSKSGGYSGMRNISATIKRETGIEV